MQLEYEKEVYNLYLNYMCIEDNNISYKMFIWDVLYNQIIISYKHIDEFNIEYWKNSGVEVYGIKHKKDGYRYWFYKVNGNGVEEHHAFTNCLTKLKEFILNNVEELDLTKCNKGDKLLMRNGEIVIFDKVDEETATSYIIDALGKNRISCNFKKNGKYWSDDIEDDRDIIKILN